MKSPKSNTDTLSLSAKKDNSNLNSQEEKHEISPNYRKVLITNLDKYMIDPAHRSTFLIQKEIFDAASHSIDDDETI